MTDTAAKPASPVKSGGMIKSSMVFSGVTLISRVAGAARDIVVSYYMGASSTLAADAFNAAMRFPNLFRRIFAEGAFASAFVPAYSKSLERDGEAVADELAADAMAALAFATLALTVVAELAMPLVIRIFAPGFTDPAKFELAVLLTRLTMPYLPCMTIYAHLAGVLNARGRFVLSAAAPILLNFWTLVAVLPAKTPEMASIYAAIGVIVAGISQAGLLIWGSHRSGAQVHFRWLKLTPEVKALIALAVPGALAASATQISVMVSSALVSHVPGGMSWLAVCDRLYQLPQGLVGVAIGVALLPQMSRAVLSGDKAASRKTMDDATLFAMAFALPCAAALVSIPFFLVDALYVRGEFTIFDAHQTAKALLQYGWGVPAFVLVQLTNRAFFAHGDTKTPMKVGLICVGINLLVGITLFHLVGVWGVAAATSAAWWCNVLMMSVILHRRGLYTPSGKTLNRLARLLAASAALGLFLAGASHIRPRIEAFLSQLHVPVLGPKEICVLLVSAAAVALYPPLLVASGGLSLREIKSGLRRPRKISVEEAVADKPPEG